MNQKIKLFLIIISAFSFSSCLKERIGNIYAGGDNTLNVIEFKNTGDNQASQSSLFPMFYSDLGSLSIGQSNTITVNVGYSGVNAAPEDITLTLAIDQASLNTYNTQNGTSYVIPTTDIYTAPATIVIKKGERTAQTTLTIKATSTFDFSKAYAIPLKISSTAPSFTISGNFGSAVYAFGVRNAFDGVYSYKGFSLRGGDPVLTGNFTGKTMSLVTNSASSVQFAAFALWGDGASGIGIGYPVLSVSSTGTGSIYPVTISSSGGAINAPGYNSVYNSATKTFFVSFTWGAGPSARLSTDTLTYLRAR